MPDRFSATDQPSVCGIVVTYHPAGEVVENLRAVMRECGTVVVVDNGSSEEELAPMAALDGVTILRLGDNLGIAAALNRGAAWAQERGFRWCVTFDQDSRPAPGMVARMDETRRRFPQAAMIGPTIREEAANAAGYRWVAKHPRFPWIFRRIGCRNEDLPEVTMLISSGSMFDLAVWAQLGGFDEGLFIDYVDVDFCLKLLRANRTIAVAAAAVLDHRLGDRRTVRVLGAEVRPMGHAAFRHYYMARNRVAMWRRHAGAVPHWAWFDLAFAVFNTLRVLAFEPQRGTKLRMMLRGTWHGLQGRRGPAPGSGSRGPVA